MTRLWNRLRSATPEERAVSAEALALLVAARIALWLVPFAAVRRLLDSYARLTHAAPRSAERTAWAVAAAARRLPTPFRDCLPQALVAEAMLKRHGAPAELLIGVRSGGVAGRVQAHAWVVSGDRVVVGGLDDLPTYVPLASTRP